ncbi:MAG: MBL fold metallo-hydrolase [Euryarchaeota archaeon]|nr:MBL fold metallo-hydrolase [Euryarchaeota archaeon]
MDIHFLGGASQVGRLGMLLRQGPAALLFDYGMLPGKPPQYPIEAPPIDAAFISHAHLDHSGMIPWLTSRHATDIYATPPTLDVADLLLADSLKVADAEGFEPPFSGRDVEECPRYYQTIEFGETVEVNGLEVTLHSAGHIPGASMFEINGPETVVFTGDLQTVSTELVLGAKPVKCDTLVIESTYAGRQHPDRLKTEYEFLNFIESIARIGGLAVVPAFAVGRTQEVLMTLARKRFDTFLDGMGKEVNSIYVEHHGYVRSTKKLRQAMNRTRIIHSPRGREKALGAEVIVTTSGMLDGGPVLRYLDAIKDDPNSALLFTGYQVPGTNGRRLMDEGMIELNGSLVKPRFQSRYFDFSAHAGHDELVEFIEACDPKRVVLMHGDNRQALADALEGPECLLPVEGQWYSL